LDLALVGKCRRDLVRIDLVFVSNIGSLAFNGALRAIEGRAAQISIDTALKMQVSLKDSVVNRRAYKEEANKLGRYGYYQEVP
jgi:hypothetical protein